MGRNLTRGFSLGVAVLWILCAALLSTAQDKVPVFKPGDRVEILTFGKWLPGTVAEIDSTGRRVKARLDERALSEIPASLRSDYETKEVPINWVRRASGGAGANKGSADPQSPSSPSDKPPSASPEKRPASSTPEAPQRRTWSDRAGKFTVEATFVELKDGTVGLMRADGKRIDVPLEKLSDADAKYVHSLEESESPFTESAAARSKVAPQADTVGTSSIPGAKLLRPDWKSAKTVQPAAFPKWTFQPVGGVPAADAKLPSTAIALGDLPDSKANESVLALRVAQDGTRAIVVREGGRAGRSTPVFVQNVDLAKGTCDEPAQLMDGTAYLDALPEQGLVLLRSEGPGFGNAGTVIIAKLEGAQLTALSQWTPYENEKWAPHRDITHGWFLAADRVMTSNHSGEALVIWDTASAKALLAIPLEAQVAGMFANTNLVLSPDRRLLAVRMQTGIAIIDLQAGLHAATIPIERSSQGNLAFSDDNRHMASIQTDGLVRWDLATGTKSEKFKHAAMWAPASSKVQWAADFLLVNSRHLYDPERRILLWDFQSVPEEDKWRGASHRGSHDWFWDSFSASEGHAGRLWGIIAESQRTTQLISAAVPGEEAVKLDKELPSPDKLLIMRPGDMVSIKVDVDADIDSPDNVKAAISANLTEAGFKIADSADLVVTAFCKRKPQQTIKIDTGFDWVNHKRGEIVERSITPCVTTLALTLKGEKVWGEGGLAQPGMVISLQKDETLDQALDRLTKPGIEWIKKRKYDPYLTRPGKATAEGAYGTSDLPAVDKPATNRPSRSNGILPALPGKFGAIRVRSTADLG
jgi:hypothetical protein